MTSAPATAPAKQVGGFNEAAFEAFLEGRDEPTWLLERRRDAFARFLAAPWPNIRSEEWLRTDIRSLKLDAFAPTAPHSPSDRAKASLAAAYEMISGRYATGIQQIDTVTTRTADTMKLNGALFVELARAAKEYPKLLERYLLTDAVSASADVFSALHAAFWSGGSLLYVPKGVKVDVPLFSLIGLSAEGRVDMNHTLVVLEEGAEASLVQETASREHGGAPALHVGAVELYVGRGARLRFVNIQNWDLATWHFSRERALLGADASLQWTVGGLGARLAKVNQEVALTGPGSQAQVNGVMFTTGRQNLTYITRQDHQAPHTTSDLLYKGVLKDES